MMQTQATGGFYGTDLPNLPQVRSSHTKRVAREILPERWGKTAGNLPALRRAIHQPILEVLPALRSRNPRGKTNSGGCMKRILVLAVWLMACAPDTVPPVLVSSQPSEGANQVFFGEDLRLQFSENVLPSSVNISTIRLTAVVAGTTTPVSHSATVEGSTVRVRITAMPTLPANLMLVAEGVSDSSGNRTANLALNFSSEPWLRVGENPNASPAKSAPCLAHWNDAPVLAWTEKTAQLADNIFVKRWTGTTWQPLGESLNISPARSASAPILVAKNNQNPVVAWTESNGSKQQLYVKRWTGSTWQTLQASGFDPSLNLQATSDAADPSLALDSSGNPVVAWAEKNSTDFTVYVKRWNGSAWQQLGGIYLDVVPSANAISPSVAIGTDNQPVVVWSENQSLMVKRFDGNTWSRLEGIRLNLYRAYAPQIVVDSSNTPVVAWQEDIASTPVLDNTDIHVRRWSGTDWVVLGGKLNTQSAAIEPRLQLGNDVPTVLFRVYDSARSQLIVKRFDGTAWLEFAPFNAVRSVGTGSLTFGSTQLPQLAYIDTLSSSLGVLRLNHVR
jgi:hypothetical protein